MTEALPRVAGSECRIGGQKDSGYYVSTPVLGGMKYLRRDGEWHVGTGGLNDGYWPTREAAAEYWQPLPPPPT